MKNNQKGQADGMGLTPQQAREDLKKDFGEEGLETLLNGVDAIIDITKKFGMPYHQVVEKMKEDEKAGKIRMVGDSIIAVENGERKE